MLSLIGRSNSPPPVFTFSNIHDYILSTALPQKEGERASTYLYTVVTQGRLGASKRKGLYFHFDSPNHLSCGKNLLVAPSIY